MDKLKETGLGEKVILAAAVVLLVDSFLPWYSVDLGPFGSYSKNGWGAPDSLFSVLAVLIGLVMGAQVALHRMEVVQFPEKVGNLHWGMVHLIAGAVAFALVVVKWLGNTDFTAIGLYLGLLSTAGLAVGGFLYMRGESAVSAPPSAGSV